MFKYIKELCNLNGTSGRENKIRDYIISKIPNQQYRVDNMGNLIVDVKGKSTAKKKVTLFAHMDEVGFIATYITQDGLIKFATVGGIMPAVLTGKKVVFENDIIGVIGTKPVHLSTPDEKNTLLTENDLYINIGAENKEDAEKYISLGDTAVFAYPYEDLGDKILSKALDDRIGCAVMLKMINEGVKYDTSFVFSVQEEVGLRGAGCAANAVKPDYAIVLEATTAADIAGVSNEKRVCVQNEGAVLSFMDNSTVYDRDVFNTAINIAKEKGIPFQLKTMVAGGNDSGVIHKSAFGIKTCAVSVPCRYIHSASCLCTKTDINAVYALAKELSESLANA